MDERRLLSGPADCLFLAINFSLRIALLSVSGNRLTASNLTMHFPGLKNSWNFIFWSKYFVLFESWKHSLSLSQNMPQKVRFSSIS